MWQIQSRVRRRRRLANNHRDDAHRRGEQIYQIACLWLSSDRLNIFWDSQFYFVHALDVNATQPSRRGFRRPNAFGQQPFHATMHTPDQMLIGLARHTV
jgi:hypothetical protein